MALKVKPHIPANLSRCPRLKEIITGQPLAAIAKTPSPTQIRPLNNLAPTGPQINFPRGINVPLAIERSEICCGEFEFEYTSPILS
ncbi:hypothetical protein EAI_14375 [Harpegnathos saltator]|uniref:Uncharacterized protein n=1 Tax=Harpegnathos saltator TaxID=610380 RepID=E2BS42_HARSA|nr:hypothetical protein EAI_14375 [Harpegnathos saltator]